MATELERTIRKTADGAVENTVMGTDLVTGAAVTVADNIARVVNHPVREAHKIERRGAAANRRFGRDIDSFVEDATEAVEAMMPERVALAGIHAIKQRARRSDLVGEVAYQWLKLVNGGLETMLGTVTRLEKATEPPARHSSAATRKATRPVRKAVRTARSTRRTAGSRVRRATTSARRQERATA